MKYIEISFDIKFGLFKGISIFIITPCKNKKTTSKLDFCVLSVFKSNK